MAHYRNTVNSKESKHVVHCVGGRADTCTGDDIADSWKLLNTEDLCQWLLSITQYMYEQHSCKMSQISQIRLTIDNDHLPQFVFKMDPFGQFNTIDVPSLTGDYTHITIFLHFMNAALIQNYLFCEQVQGEV